MALNITNEDKYLSSTVVVCSEVIKFFMSILLTFIQTTKIKHTTMCNLPVNVPNFNCKTFIDLIKSEIINKPFEALKLVVPAILFTIQTNLVLYALSILDAATFQVIILFTF